MQKSSLNLGFYAKILQGTVSWQYGRAQEHWAFEDFDNHTISTTPNIYCKLSNTYNLKFEGFPKN